MNINKVFLMGRLTQDPELKMSSSGIPNMKFSVAVNRRVVKQDENNGRPTADFIRCVAFNKTAEFISKYFKKGSLIIIFGSIQNSTYKDRDGNDRQSTEIIVDEVQFGESKQDRGGQPQTQSFGASSQSETADKPSQGNAPVLNSGLNNEFFDDIKDIEDELPF